jgi:cyanate lyase
MDPVRKLLKHFKDDKGISYKRMSEEIGRNHAYIQQFVERGSPRTLPEEAREKLAAFLGIEPAALKLAGRTRASRGDPLAPELFQLKEIPVIGEVAAGLWMDPKSPWKRCHLCRY